MPIDLEAQLASPTPLASTVWSLALLAVLGALYLLFKFLRGKRPPTKGKDTAWDKIIAAVRALDGALITYGSYVTGTRYERRWVRVLVLITYFTTIALIAAFAPWPWGLLPIVLGVFSIFVVFRHWTVDEDERFDEVQKGRKKIPIDGDLNAEVLIACAFLFVYAPSAFAQLQANGYGFQVSPNAGPFAFIIYTLLEAVKAGSLVDYYDLFAERLGFEKYAGARNPSPWAKWAVIAYRLSLNLLLLAALKRLLDIARRMAEGRDLRHIEGMLVDPEEDQQLAAVEKLKEFALRGRGNARDLLERVLQPGKSDAWRLGADVRYAAAVALVDYVQLRGGGSGSLYAAIAGYRRILDQDWTRTEDPQGWAMTQTSLGIALAALGGGATGETTGNLALLNDAVAAYSAALEVHTRAASPTQWARIKNNLGNVLMTIGEQTGDDALLTEAVAAYRAALEVRTRDTVRNEWAGTQNNLAFVLSHLGERTGDPVKLQDAEAAFREGLEATSRCDTPVQWAMIQNGLALVLTRLGKQTRDLAQLQEAVVRYRAALEVRTLDARPTDFAMTQTFLGNVLQIIGDRTGNLGQLREAVDCYREALKVRTQTDRPAQWAMSQLDLGCALLTLAKHEKSLPRLQEARAAVVNALAFDPDEKNWRATLRDVDEAIAAFNPAPGGCIRNEQPAHSHETQKFLGNTGLSTDAATPALGDLEKAIADNRSALDVCDREAAPIQWAATKTSLATALYALGAREPDSTRLEEAIAAYRAALAVYTRDAMPMDWAATQDGLGTVLSTLGARTGNPARLEEAVTAFRAALEIYTREIDPFGWSMIQHSLGRALALLGEGEKSVTLLKEARQAIASALEVDREDKDWQQLLSEIDEAISNLRQN